MKKNYHSLLFVPAVPGMLAKIESVKADAVIADLEDGILSQDKEKALMDLKEFLGHYSFDRDIFVRINPDRAKRETSILNPFKITGYMLPKAEDLEGIARFRGMISGKKLIALIETLRGVADIEKIAASSCVDMIAFGAEDFTGQSGIKNEEEFLSCTKSRIVLYAKAYGRKVFDTVSLNITDKEECLKSAQRSRDYGFDGKLAIHPMQAEAINEAFGKRDIAYYRYVLEEYDKSGKAVLKLDGRIYERPHIETIRRCLREWEE